MRVGPELTDRLARIPPSTVGGGVVVRSWCGSVPVRRTIGVLHCLRVRRCRATVRGHYGWARLPLGQRCDDNDTVELWQGAFRDLASGEASTTGRSSAPSVRFPGVALVRFARWTLTDAGSTVGS
jgi:hypothetical protein